MEPTRTRQEIEAEIQMLRDELYELEDAENEELETQRKPVIRTLEKAGFWNDWGTAFKNYIAKGNDEIAATIDIKDLTSVCLVIDNEDGDEEYRESFDNVEDAIKAANDWQFPAKQVFKFVVEIEARTEEQACEQMSDKGYDMNSDDWADLLVK